jgi:hypothetical protein
MVVLPLVVTSLVSGLAGLGREGKFGRVGLKTFVRQSPNYDKHVGRIDSAVRRQANLISPAKSGKKPVLRSVHFLFSGYALDSPDARHPEGLTPNRLLIGESRVRCTRFSVFCGCRGIKCIPRFCFSDKIL